MIITRSPMRITLGGGGTDLPYFYTQHEGYVLTMAIDKYFYTFIRPRNDGIVQIMSSDFKTMEMKKISQLDRISLEIPRVVMKHFGTGHGCDIFMGSEIPSGTGLGSSGSVVVNMVKAFSTLGGKKMTKKEIADTACHLEMDVMHATVGKQDQFIAAFGGIQNLLIRRDGFVNVSELNMSKSTKTELEKNLLVFYTGIRRDAATTLKEQSKASTKTVEHMMFIKELGLRSRDALLTGDLTTFAALMRDHWEHKKKSAGSVTNETVDRLYNIGIANGALSGKLLGAGGGGFLLFYADKNHEKIRSAMEKEGLGEVDVRIDEDGVISKEVEL